MNSLLDKVSLLISANTQSIMRQARRDRDPAAFFRYYMQIEDRLVDVAKAIHHCNQEIEAVRLKGAHYAAKITELDQQIDGLLLAGNDDEALKLQRDLNQLQRFERAYRTKIRGLGNKREQLLQARDSLESRLELMEPERKRLETLYRQPARNRHANEEQSQSSERVYRVVDE